MREQKGYVFHRYGSWFVRYCDDVMQPEGTIKRKLVCKKLDVPYGEEYRTRKSVQPFVDAILASVNSGKLNPASTQTVCDFVDNIYLKEYVEKNLRAASLKQYRDVWNNHLKPRMGKLTLRDCPRRADACENRRAGQSRPQFPKTLQGVPLRRVQAGEAPGHS